MAKKTDTIKEASIQPYATDRPGPAQASLIEELMGETRRLVEDRRWLPPISSLGSKGGVEFGRNVKDSLFEIAKQREPMRLQLHRSDAAVVMSVDLYEEMLRVKAACAELIEQVKVDGMNEADDEYEALYRRITSPESRRAADSLFSTPPAELEKRLRKAYLAGKKQGG